MRRKYFALCALLLLCAFASGAYACDLCSIYNSLESQKGSAGAFQVGMAEQFTSYSKLQNGGKFVENSEHQRLSSSITQVFAGYNISDSISAQVSLPYINRRFTRLEGEEIQRGTEAGIGDMPLIVRYTPYRYHEAESAFSVQLLAGIKLPTGDSSRLKEEQEEGSPMPDSIPMHAALRHEHGEIGHASAVHGHDLALGSGSFDFPLGARVFAESGRIFGSAEIQYSIRSKGDYNYRYANDLLWNAGPAYYLVLHHDTSVALRANLSGDYKGMDFGNGEKQLDTSTNAVFLGPQLLVATGNCLNGEVGIDFPVQIENSGVQTVSSYRIRAGLTYKF